jgi:4-alpha-glucanotransferase
MPRGGALRIDHVMALMRLYWIPLGAKADRGGYVSYPLRELVAVLAERKPPQPLHGDRRGPRHRAAEVREALSAAGRALRIGRCSSSAARRRVSARRAGLRPAPTTCRPGAAYWAGNDLKLRSAHRLTVDFEKERNQRARYK